MLRFSANISMLFQEVAFLDRFEAARKAGFKSVECWFPYDHSHDDLRRVIRDTGVALSGINTAAGNAAAGEWGLAAVPGRQAEFSDHIDQALDYARALDVGAIHVMAGMVAATDETRATYIANLRDALRRAGEGGPTLLIEPLNKRDRPGYFLPTSDEAVEILKTIGSDGLKLLFDIYHVQVGEGDVTRRLKSHFAHIGHVQVASVPARAEPGEGELDVFYVLRELDALGWNGWVGCEYKPKSSTEAGLTWLDNFK